jgi:hypothetical protein
MTDTISRIKAAIGLPDTNKVCVAEIRLSYDEAKTFSYDPDSSQAYLKSRGVCAMSAGEQIHRALNANPIHPEALRPPVATSMGVEHDPFSCGYIIRLYAERTYDIV